MVKITGPLASHHASGRISAPRIYSSSLRNRHDREAPPAPPPPTGGSLLFASTTHMCNAPTVDRSDQLTGTIEVWINLNTRTGRIAGTRVTTATEGIRLIFHYENITITAYINDQIFYITQAVDLPLNQWLHLAITWNSTLMTYWLDGVWNKMDTPSPTTTQHNSGFFIGGERLGTSERYQGYITQVRFSDIVRYDSDFTPAKDFTPDANTIALWKMSEGSGTTVADESGNGHTLNFPPTNRPTWSDLVP